MLAGAGNRCLGGGLGGGLLLGHSLRHIVLHRGVEQALLLFNRAVGRADQQIHPVRCRCVDHLPHGRSDAGIHLIAVLHFLSLHRPVLRQRVVGIGKQQVIFLLFLRELLRQLFVLRLLLGLFASLFLVGRLLLGLLLVRRLLLRRLLGGLCCLLLLLCRQDRVAFQGC